VSMNMRNSYESDGIPTRAEKPWQCTACDKTIPYQSVYLTWKNGSADKERVCLQCVALNTGNYRCAFVDDWVGGKSMGIVPYEQFLKDVHCTAGSQLRQDLIDLCVAAHAAIELSEEASDWIAHVDKKLIDQLDDMVDRCCKNHSIERLVLSRIAGEKP